MEPLRNLNDEELAVLLRSDSSAVFAEIFERYNGLLYIHACKKLPNKEEAKDIVQEVFISLWSNRESLVLKSNLPGLLYTSVYRKILDRVARKKLRIDTWIINRLFCSSQPRTPTIWYGKSS